jgi:hypothetical protein
MDETIARFTTPEACEQFALNVEARSPARALEARRRAVELRALSHGATTAAEREALQAIYAYERTLFKKHGKHQQASYTWRMVERVGIIAAVESAVSRRTETAGYRALIAEGMQDMAFESVVLRHPDAFSAEAVEKSKKRLEEWKNAGSEAV